MKHWQSVANSLLIGLVIIIIDRITKIWALGLEQDRVITPFFSLSLAFNRGISCGYFDDAGTVGSCILVVVISIVILAVFYALCVRWRQGKSIVAETLVVAGAVANMLDRYMYGAVIDFILIHYRGWEFPIFNGADMAIVIGVALLVIRDLGSSS